MTTPAPTRPDQLHMSSTRQDMGVSFSRPFRREDHLSVMLEPSRPLDWGFDEASAHVAPEHVDRLTHWLLTGKALPRGERVPHPAETILDPEVVVPSLLAATREHRFRGRVTVTTGACDCGVELTVTGGPLRDAATRVSALHAQHVAEAQLAAVLAALTTAAATAEAGTGA